MKFFKFIILLLGASFFVACGSSGSDKNMNQTNEQNYCVQNLNPDHFSPNGSCFQIQSIQLSNYTTDYNPITSSNISAKTNRDTYLAFTYDDSDFVGDVELFSFVLSFKSSDLNQSNLSIKEPLALGGGWIINSSKEGNITLTLSAKDGDFVLDEKVVYLHIKD